MRFSAVLLLFISTLVLGQQAATPPAPPATAADIPPTAPVITINGLCDHKPATGAAPADCKTTVTRAEFERLASSLSPNLPPAARQRLADEYTKALIFSAEAKKRGLDSGPRIDEIMRFVRMQIVSQDLVKQLQQEARPTPEQIAQYYKDHEAQYQEVALKRIFIPKNRAEAKPDEKPDEAALATNAEKIRARAVAGEDFDKLQKEVFDAAGFKTPPPTTIPSWRRQSVPASQASVFDLKPGEVSSVLSEAIGMYIYRLESKRTIPLEQVKSEIESNLSQEKLSAEMQSIASGVKTELNEAYFQGAQRPPVDASAAQPGAPKAAVAAQPAPAKPAARKDPATQSK
ncbi:MAG TPA: peptidyl-prolyl cis-trans isomerase [Terriglobales bacterium]|nr:peptidyl-prolyl cis-trans isomerase [Terriglobales bacterium]